MLVPGTQVKVISWYAGGSENNIRFSTVQTWSVPSLSIRFEEEVLKPGERAIVLAVLLQHEYKCDDESQADIHDWVLLLTNRGTLGWTQELQGLSAQLFG